MFDICYFDNYPFDWLIVGYLITMSENADLEEAGDQIVFDPNVIGKLIT